jgi:hypothetical protein
MRCFPGAALALLGVITSGSASAAGVAVDQKVDLPGFSLSLPAGEVINSTSMPSAGAHQIKPAVTGVANPLLSIYWTQHGRSHAEWIVMNRDKVFGSFMPGTPGVAKEENVLDDRWVGQLGDDDSGGSVAIVTCEPGFSIMFVVNVSNRTEDDLRVAREMAKSVRCALTDANRHKPDATARLSRRFARIPDPGSQMYYSYDDELIMANIIAGNSFAHGIDVMQTLMLGIMAKSVNLGPQDVQFVRVQEDASPGGGRLLARFNGHEKIERRYIGVLYCENIAATVNVVMLLPKVDDAKAKQVFDAFSCPGGQSTELGDINDVARETCAAGIQKGCQLRDLL